jgi:selenocysteine lyase/cysteine desulfurase
LHVRFGVPSSARASFGPYTTEAEVRALAAAVLKVRRIFG